MNILVLTTKYHIEGRPDLLHDTSAIHYLVKYWTREHEVAVFNVYHHRYMAVARYLKKENRENYQTGYDYEADNVKVHLAETQKLPRQNNRFFKRQASAVMRQFREWIDRISFAPDVIVVHFPCALSELLPGFRKCMGEKIPVIGVLHQSDIEGIQQGLMSAKELDGCCDAVFSRSKSIREVAQACGVGHLRDEIVWSGVPLQEDTELTLRSGSDEPLRLLYAGKLIKRKNIDQVLRAVAELKDEIPLRMEIVGSGKEENALRQLSDSLGIKDIVRFSGRVSRDEVIRKMSQADLFCMPSVRETFGLTNLEAMSVGCIPVSTKGEGVDGIVVDRDNGYLVDRDHIVGETVSAVREFVGLSDNEKIKMRKRAADTAKRFNEEKCSLNYLEYVIQAYHDCFAAD